VEGDDADVELGPDPCILNASPPAREAAEVCRDLEAGAIARDSFVVPKAIAHDATDAIKSDRMSLVPVAVPATGAAATEPSSVGAADAIPLDAVVLEMAPPSGTPVPGAVVEDMSKVLANVRRGSMEGMLRAMGSTLTDVDLDLVLDGARGAPACAESKGEEPAAAAGGAGEGDALHGGPVCRRVAAFAAQAAEDGTTLLHVAALKAHTRIVRVLLLHGARVNAQDADGCTPLHLAVSKARCAATVALLVRAGASAMIADAKGRTPLSLGQTIGYVPLLWTLVNRKSCMEARFGACDSCMDEQCLLPLERCGHELCLTCHTGWARKQLFSDGLDPDALTCGVCGVAMSTADVRVIVPSDVLERAERRTVERVLSREPSWRWCNSCPSGGFAPPHCTTPVPCETCHAGYCVPPARLEEHKESVGFKESHCKPCPKCEAPILKDGGCSHMTCRSCTYEFCWICRQKYKGRYVMGNVTKCTCG